MSHLRNNQQQRERIVNNLGGEPRQNGGAFERARNPINPPMPPGNVVVDPVFVNPVPPLGNNVILNANPPLEDNIILHADPPMRNNRGPPVNVAPGPQRRRGRRGGNNQILQEVPLVQFPAIIPQAMFPPPPPPPAFVQPIIPIQVPSVLLQPPPVPVQAAYFPPFVPQAVVPVVQQPPPFRQQPFLNLDPDLFPPRPNVGSMEPASWNRPPPPPPPPPGVAPGAPIGPRLAPQGPPPAPQGPPFAPQGQPLIPQGPPPAPQGPPAALQGQQLAPQEPPPAPEAPLLPPSLPLPAQHGGGFGAHSAMWAEAARHQLRTVWTRAPGPPPPPIHRDQRAEGDAAEVMAANNMDQGAEGEVAEPVVELHQQNRIERELNELVAEDDDVDQRVEAVAPEPGNEQDSASSATESDLEEDEPDAAPVYHWRGERVHPSLHANFDGSYFIILANRVTMEMSVNHCMRLRFSDVTVFMNEDGSVCSVTHGNVRMVMNRGRVAGIFTLSSVTDQMFIAGDEGILFTASNLDNAYFVSLQEGLSSIPMALLNFNLDPLNEDITSIHFRDCARLGREVSLFSAVRGIVEAARTFQKRPWKVNIYVHGQFVRYILHGEVIYRHGARTLHYSRRKCFLNLKTPFMDMTVTYNRQIEMKFGNKRIHVSRTGIIVADGARTATMDHFGRLISRT